MSVELLSVRLAKPWGKAKAGDVVEVDAARAGKLRAEGYDATVKGGYVPLSPIARAVFVGETGEGEYVIPQAKLPKRKA